MTDEELDRVASGELGVGPSVGERLIAQAREANALRDEIEMLRMLLGDRDIDVRIAREGYYKARAQLAEAREQLAAQAPVVEASIEMRTVESADVPGDSIAELEANQPAAQRRTMRSLLKWRATVDTYRVWLASRQPPTNVPALIASMVVARVSTDESGAQKMELATVDGEVKS